MARPTLYYVRHGETDWNAEARLQGRHDIPLNAKGRAQAVRCGAILANLFARDIRTPADFDYLVSPLTRARTTMELLRAKLNLNPRDYVADPLLTEISFGQWEGFTLAELQATDPNGVAMREREKWNFVPPGGESYRALAGRMGGWYEGLTRDAVVVAHGGTLRALIAYLGLAPTDTAPSYDVAQNVVYVLTPDAISRYA
jgi:broad specificity phosphatase PhoE